MNNNPNSLYSDLDVDKNNVITVYEYGLQQWSNGRLTSLNLNYNEYVVTPTFCNFRLMTLPENIGDLLDLMENFSEHVEGVYKLETYYGDEILQGLVKHSKDIVEDIKEYEDIYSLIREPEETGDAEEG